MLTTESLVYSKVTARLMHDSTQAPIKTDITVTNGVPMELQSTIFDQLASLDFTDISSYPVLLNTLYTEIQRFKDRFSDTFTVENFVGKFLASMGRQKSLVKVTHPKISKDREIISMMMVSDKQGEPVKNPVVIVNIASSGQKQLEEPSLEQLVLERYHRQNLLILKPKGGIPVLNIDFSAGPFIDEFSLSGAIHLNLRNFFSGEHILYI